MSVWPFCARDYHAEIAHGLSEMPSPFRSVSRQLALPTQVIQHSVQMSDSLHLGVAQRGSRRVLAGQRNHLGDPNFAFFALVG
jgi:hypothetical protein